jgi:exodeoxyribonuclease V alpha subunit
MNKEFFHLSKQLVSIAANNLMSGEKDNLIQIINQLFTDISNGHSCSKLSELNRKIGFKDKEIINILDKSKLIHYYTDKKPITKPISILDIGEDSLIYISKYLYYESNIKIQVEKLTSATNNLPANYTKYLEMLDNLSQSQNLPNTEQLRAIKIGIQNKLSFITGGPGTGKTTTVTLLLWLIYQIYGNAIQVKICAPTGKAAKRVKESIIGNLDNLAMHLDVSALNKLLDDNTNFATIHKILGVQKNNIYFKYNKANQLKLDVLIIDESSMISLPLYSKLLEAIDTNTVLHIIFLGDRNQLSSVEEGYVFGSLINPGSKHDLFSSKTNISELIVSKRNIGAIGVLTNAVLSNDIKIIEDTLVSADNIKLYKPRLNNILDKYLNSHDLTDYLSYARVLADAKTLFAKFNAQSILCLTNVGLLGTINLNLQIEKHIKQKLFTIDTWYSGRPIIILENDYTYSLHNGDIGICVIIDNIPKIMFDDGRMFIPEALPKYELAYAISIHKSQGSEYKHAYVVLPPSFNESTNCSREILYTGISRAKDSLTLFTTLDVIEQAINKPTIRNTGLSYFLN